MKTEKIPSVFRVPIVATVAVLGAVVAAFVIWTACGSVAENVYGGGGLRRQTRNAVITSPADGLVVAFNVRTGDLVKKGQLLGRLYVNADEEALAAANRRLAAYAEGYRTYLAKCRDLEKRKTARHAAMGAHLDAFEARLKKQLEWYEGNVRRMTELQSRGGVSQLDLQRATDCRDDRLSEDEKTAVRRIENDADLDDFMSQTLFNLAEREADVIRTSNEALCLLRETSYRRLIVATSSGRVYGVNAAPGDHVRLGQDLLMIDVGESSANRDTMVAVTYFPVVEARKLAIGMDAVVTPSTVKTEREGGIRGFVSDIARNVSTPESITCEHRNRSMTDWIVAQCGNSPVRVEIVLRCDPTTSSGFRWTGGRGPDIRIDDNTMCAAAVTVRRLSPLELVFAKAIRYATGTGVCEGDIMDANVGLGREGE